MLYSRYLWQCTYVDIYIYIKCVIFFPRSLKFTISATTWHYASLKIFVCHTPYICICGSPILLLSGCISRHPADTLICKRVNCMPFSPFISCMLLIASLQHCQVCWTACLIIILMDHVYSPRDSTYCGKLIYALWPNWFYRTHFALNANRLRALVSCGKKIKNKIVNL